FLGSVFGFARGIVFLLAFVIVAGLTPLPRMDWWQRSAFVPPLVAGVHALRPHLPAAIAGRLDYAPRREPPATKAPQQAELHRRGVSD
ncbi:MAG TPA: CvpA family protein, partial [Rhodanobacteraceae bacterium]